MSMSEEIRASAAAHQELGPAYDAAVAEGLVERIGDEIDRRIDARLGAPAAAVPARAPVAAPQPHVPGQFGAGRVVLGLGSIALAIGATLVVLRPEGGGPLVSPPGPFIALIWIAIVGINAVSAWATLKR